MGRQGFGGLLENRQWREFLDNGQEWSFGGGKTIIRQGDKSDTVHILDRGFVKVSMARANGTDTLLALRGPGESLGELSVLSGLPRTATVTASDGGCVTYVLSGERFQLLVARMGLERTLWEHIVRRQQEVELLRAEMFTRTPRQRLAETLLRLSPLLDDDFGGGPAAPGRRRAARRRLDLTQQELGEAVGRSLSWVQEELRLLRAAGVISTGRGHVEVHDRAALRRLVEHETEE